MMLKRKIFSTEDVELVARKILYQGFFRMEECSVRHRLFDGRWSRVYQRELFVRGPAVGVLLFDPQRNLVGLIEQFRVGALDYPCGPWLLEIVAGIVEEGETAAEVAHRELLEEAGIENAELVPICDYLVSPGGTSESMTLYCALVNLEGKGGIHGLADENEDICLHVLSYSEAREALASGLCNNAPLIIALQWLNLHHDALCRGTVSGP